MSASRTRGGHNNGLPQLGRATIEQSCSTNDDDVVYVCVYYSYELSHVDSPFLVLCIALLQHDG